MKSVVRRYTRDFLFSMGAYVVVLLISVTLLNISPSTAWWRVPLALTPVVPSIFAILAYLRFVRDTDELQRRIQLEGLAFGFGASGLLTFSYGFLENIGFPHIGLIWVFPLMIFSWGIGTAIASRRYA